MSFRTIFKEWKYGIPNGMQGVIFYGFNAAKTTLMIGHRTTF
jgi:hypothetical protein